jgi:hypothetical protein
VTGHGHVNPEPVVARCGGPAICPACATERCRSCGSIGAQPHAATCARTLPGEVGRICGACRRPGAGWYHVRLGSPVHDAEECLRNLRGEDVRGHCMVQLHTDSDLISARRGGEPV